MAKKRTVTVTNIEVKGNVRAERVIPVEDSVNTPCPADHSKRWKGTTVSFRLSKEQGIQLARVLLAVTQEWDELWVIAWRKQKRADGTYPVTVTSTAEGDDG